MISKSMLCMTADYYKLLEMDEDRNPVFTDEKTTLESVYVVYNDGQSNGAHGKEPASRAVLYYDKKLSKPDGIIFSKGDKIDVENISFYVENIRPLVNKNGLQHYEVDLI